jgi:glycosyltransferase involved in cell wall biosynthesis
MNPNYRPHIVHVGKYYPPHVGGIETHLHALCRELKHSMEVRVLVANDKRRDEHAIIEGVNVSRLAIQFSIAGAPVCTAMAWKLRKLAPDLVHVHLPNPAGVLAVLASGYKGKILATWHSDVVRQRRLAKIFAPIQRRFLKNCASIVVTSPNYLESSPELTEFKDRCRVIPYGIELNQFKHANLETVEAIRNKIGGRIILAVGRLVYYKGFEYLIRAMRQTNATLVIIGDGPLRRELENDAQRIGVAERVVFLGELQPPDIIPYYHACDVFVLPSVARSEAFGIVQLEAMACGKPVVNTQIDSGVPFVSLDGVTGITVPSECQEPLATAINHLLDHPHLRAEYGSAALKRVETEFSLEVMVNRTKELYLQVISADPHEYAHAIAK